MKEGKRKGGIISLYGAKKFGHRSHVRFEHLCKNKGFKEWIDRDLRRLRRKYLRGGV